MYLEERMATAIGDHSLIMQIYRRIRYAPRSLDVPVATGISRAGSCCVAHRTCSTTIRHFRSSRHNAHFPPDHRISKNHTCVISTTSMVDRKHPISHCSGPRRQSPLALQSWAPSTLGELPGELSGCFLTYQTMHACFASEKATQCQAADSFARLRHFIIFCYFRQ